MAGQEQVMKFTSRRAGMSPDELRALNDKMAMDRLFANFARLNADPPPQSAAGLADPPPMEAPRAAPVAEPELPRTPPPSAAGLNEAAVNTPKRPFPGGDPKLANVKVPDLPGVRSRMFLGDKPTVGDVRSVFDLPAWTGLPGMRTDDFKNARSTLSEMQKAKKSGDELASAAEEDIKTRGRSLIDEAAAAKERHRVSMEAANQVGLTDRKLATEMRNNADAALDTDEANILARNSRDTTAEVRATTEDEIKGAFKAQRDKLGNASKARAKVWAERGKTARNWGGGTIAGVGLAYIGGKLIEDWQQDQDTLPENVEAEGIINRFFGSGEMSDADAAKLADKVGPDMFEQILKTRPEEAPRRAPGPPLRAADSIPLLDVGYRPGAEKPSVAETPSAYDDAVAREIAKARPDLAADYAMRSQGENHRRDAMALTDAGIENTAAAAGSPDWLMNYLRDAGNLSRAQDAGGELPDMVGDSWLKSGWDGLAGAVNDYVVDPYQNLLATDDPNDPSLLLNPPGYLAKRFLPEGALPVVNDLAGAANAVFNPINIAGAVARPADELAAMPYSILRNSLLGAGQVTGLNEEAFGPVYREALRAMGGEPLLDDPVTRPAANLPAANMDFPVDSSSGFMPGDVAGDMGAGTGLHQTGMPDLQDLQKLADIGALGVNPDGSNMTVPQYLRKNPPTGMGVQPALPMSADIPVRGVVDGGLPSTMPRPGGPSRSPGEIPPLRPLAGLPDIEGLRPALPRLAGQPDLSQFMPPPPIADPGGPSVSGGGPGVDDTGPYRMSDLEAMAKTGGLGVRPDGRFVTVQEFLGKGGAAGRGVDMNASAPAVQPGGPGDQFASLGGLFGPAMASTMPDDPAAAEAARVKEEADKFIKESTASIAAGDETANPRGQFEPEAAPPSPVDTSPTGVEEPGGWWESWFGSDNGKTADQYRAEAAAPAAPPTQAGLIGPPAPPTTATTAAVVANPNGPRGDYGGSKGSVDAGLADDAAAADEELNWINRMMRDKLGLTDKSQRAKAAEALISGGAAMLASRGDSWQALGEGLQAGYGTVTQMNDEEAASLAAAQSAMADESRWQQEMALKRLQAVSSGGGDKMSTVQAYMKQLMDAGWEYQAAKDEAERYAGVKSPTAWSQSDIFDMIKANQQEPA
jgi:hypothetical protein